MKRKQGMTRGQAQLVHANKRAKQRFGITPSAAFYRQLVAKIQTTIRRLEKIGEAMGRCTFWEVILNGQTAVAVFDRFTCLIRTFLEPNMDIGGHPVFPHLVAT